ncbi:MAG: hypothetical protein K2N21_08545 [Rikenellaceae bacterium]|nr:hypothetical protein [Rikenellaceae bacterium]
MFAGRGYIVIVALAVLGLLSVPGTCHAGETMRHDLLCLTMTAEETVVSDSRAGVSAGRQSLDDAMNSIRKSIYGHDRSPEDIVIAACEAVSKKKRRADRGGYGGDYAAVDDMTDKEVSDSIDAAGIAEVDTTVVRGGVLTLNSEKLLEDMYRQMQDTLSGKKVKVVQEESATAKERSRLFKDSLSFVTVTSVSFAIPGFGQLYNKQAWKIPILYGSVGGFITGGVMLNKQYKKYDRLYNQAVYNRLPAAQTDPLLRKVNKYNTQRALCFAGAAASYLFFVGDAALNYKGAVHNTRKATMLSAIFPGAGQIYNKSYWKLPIVWGGMAAFGYVIDYNNRGYQRFKKAYNYLTDDDPNTVDEFYGRYDASVLQNTRDSYRRYRDLGIIMLSGFYLLNIIDAHVDAYLRRYEISDDLSLRLEPTMMPAPVTTSRYSSNGMGVSMKINF